MRTTPLLLQDIIILDQLLSNNPNKRETQTTTG